MSVLRVRRHLKCQHILWLPLRNPDSW
jgi:hypothetical protein